ncbi:hypothetical protein FJZ36_07875 [Candidatus Poribacteria bacterium]|nr:hypothetical protein [Candidatus Poribacteria bacterium]
MKKALRLFALLMVPALVVSASALMVGCGGDDEETAKAKFVSANPADGAEIPTGSVVTVTFDADPGAVTATGGTVEGAGTTRKVTVTAASVTLTWDGGTQTLNYKLLPQDKDAPKLASSKPADNAKDVDPAGPNADGVVLEFNENISKATVKISEGGTDLGWVAAAKDKTVTLKPPKGKELVNEKTYKVEGEVIDLAGNKANVSVTFTTKAKQ